MNLQRAKSIEIKPRNNRHLMVLLLSLLAMCRERLHNHLHTRYVWEEKLRYPERWLPTRSFRGGINGAFFSLLKEGDGSCDKKGGGGGEEERRGRDLKVTTPLLSARQFRIGRVKSKWHGKPRCSTMIHTFMSKNT